MKNILQRTLLVAILALMGAAVSFAQLSVKMTISSHPDPYLSNWPNIKNTVIVIVTNTGTQSVAAKFDCKLNLNGSLQANTKPESMRILQIPPGVSQYYAEDLVPFEAVKIYGDADKKAVKTGMLPAGYYEFCVSLIDPKTNAQLTPPVCKNFSLTSYQAPVLLQPQDKSTLGKTNRPIFRWTGVSPKPPSPVSYRVVVFEVLKGQTPVTAFRVNRPILDKTVTGTQMLWPADVDLPKEGMQYIAGVIATDDQGNTVGEPNGLGGPNTFFGCCQGDTSGNDGVTQGGDTHRNDNSGNNNNDQGNTNNNSGSTGNNSGNGNTGNGTGDNGSGTTGSGKDTHTNTGDGQNPVTPATNIFKNTKDAAGDDCPTLLSPKNNAHIDRADGLVFRWSFSTHAHGKPAEKKYLVISATAKNRNGATDNILRVDVTDKTSYTVEGSVAERLIKDGGSYRWSVQNDSRTDCPSMLFSTGPCVITLKITELTAVCKTGNLIHVCMKFYYQDGQNRPMKFTQTGSGILAYQMPGYTPQLTTSNFTDILNNPITIGTLSIPSGTTYQLCFDIAPTGAGQIDVGVQGDNLNSNPNIICRPGVDSIINNPCVCNKCDSLKIKSDGGKCSIDPKTGNLIITQPMTVGPDLLTALTTEIIYIHWEPEKEKCMPCDKNPSQWGILQAATYNSVSGNPTASEANWNFSNPASNAAGTLNFTISLPQLLDCCKLHGYICIRYKFYLQPASSPSECYECEKVICYSF